MKIYGSFVNRTGGTVHIAITAPGEGTFEIGTAESGLWFGAREAFTTKSDVSGTFDHILSHTAKIGLQAAGYTAALFQSSAVGASVRVTLDGVCVFSGWIAPRTYSQDFNSCADDLQVNCVDRLGVLMSARHLDIDAPGNSYAKVRAAARQRTLKETVISILQSATPEGEAMRIWYDGCRAVDSDSAHRYTIFEDLTLSDLLFLGSDESGAWTRFSVLEEIMRYLNLRILQCGDDFYIFDLSAAKGSGATAWRDIITGDAKTTEKETIHLTSNTATDCNDKISIGDTYSRISLTADITESADMVQSPLDDDSLTSAYPRRQYYCTEYETEQSGALWALTRDTGTAYGDGVSVRHWLLRVMDNPQWKFPYYSGGMLPKETGRYLPDVYCSSGKDQQALPDALRTTQGAAIFRTACADVSEDMKNNAPASKPEESTVLVVSVNGNGSDSENTALPNAGTLKNSCPRAVYTGAAGGSLSPSDPRATNYIVFSGRISLCPIQAMTGSYNSLRNDTSDPDAWAAGRNTVQRKDGKRRWYTRRYWQAHDAFDPAQTSNTEEGWTPMSETAPQLCKFRYSAVGDSEDHVSKVAVLACMLVVGGKCAVETGTDGSIGDIVWKDYRTREECGDDDEYFSQSFTLGFDPKIGDFLVGTEFDLQNNVLWDTGIDRTGTAIAIRQSDRVAGEVQFSILGPVNTLWDEVTRRHPTFFRHTKWNTKSIPLLSHTANIQIKDFKVEICSDNGHAADTGADIVYTSATDSAYCNVKDDIVFKINSALTATEALKAGTGTAPALSNPTLAASGEPLTVVYDYIENAVSKPEKIYVNAAWQEWHEPRIELDTALEYGSYAPFAIYTHPALPGRHFFALAADADIQDSTVILHLRESDMTSGD